jgi:hypothetical protein
MRFVADSAAFPQCLMFKNEWPGLFTMTLRTILIEPRHRQAAARFENVASMGIMAFDAIDPPFEDGMMLGQIEFSMRLQVTLKTGGRIFSWINNKSGAAAPGLNVFAAGPMAGLAARLAFKLRSFKMQPAMRAGGEHARDVRMAIVTRLIAHVCGAWNVRRRHYRATH